MSQIVEDKRKLAGRIKELIEEFESEYPGVYIDRILFKRFTVEHDGVPDDVRAIYIDLEAKVE